MFKKQQVLTLVLAVGVSAGALAGEWKGEGDLGYNSVAGNSESEALALKLGVSYLEGDWTHKAELMANSASTDKKTSAEAYAFNFNSRYEIDQAMYAFGNARYQDDRFSAYNFQASLTGGVGYHLIKSEETILDIEGGLGYRSSELRLENEKQDELIGIAKLTFNQRLTSTTEFESYALTESGKDNTYVEAQAAIKVAISEKLALKLAYLAKHNTDVSPGTENTDRYTTVSLNYKF